MGDTTLVTSPHRWSWGHCIEPVVFLHTFSWGLQMVVSQDLLIAKTCRDLHYSEEVCSSINKHDEENNNVEKHVTELQMYMSILSAIPSIVIALFVGSWSDRNGRKPVMVLPMLGFVVQDVVSILNVYFWDASALTLLSTSVSGLFGGITSLFIGLYSFLSDVTTTRARTTRIALLDLALIAGLPLGSLVSGYLYTAAGYYGIFGTALGCQTVATLYVVAFIQETRSPPPDETVNLKLRRYLSVADYHHLLDVFRTTFKKRPYNLRAVILLLVSAMLLNVTAFSDGGIYYLYARKKFDWDEQQYSKFQTLIICFTTVASLLIMPTLSYLLRVHDAMIGILASMSKISALVVMSMANSGYTMFFGASLGCISTLSAVVIRSLLSKCVKRAELGKVNSLLASFEAAVPLLASPLMTEVYNSTLDTFPGAVFLVQAAIFVLAGAIFTVIFILLVRSGQDLSQLSGEWCDEEADQLINEDRLASTQSD